MPSGPTSVQGRYFQIMRFTPIPDGLQFLQVHDIDILRVGLSSE